MNEALIADPVRSKQILERIPAGRWGTAEDFEGAIVFLASKASDYVSGECLVVDGGWMGSELQPSQGLRGTDQCRIDISSLTNPLRSLLYALILPL
jgi:2-deoxy-D-gluconate 3-dehydrogenase